MAKNIVYDLNEDFVEVKEVLITESLTEEDIEEGLEAENLMLKVAITSHAQQRMYDTENRECDWELVEDLIVKKSDVLFDVKNGEEFILMNNKNTLALVCQVYQEAGMTVLVLITVIRNVYFDNNETAHEKKVKINRKEKVVY